MNEYVITTDNNSDLPEKYLTEHGVGCMYLSYAMDGKNYTHGNFLPEHEFYEAMRNGSMPTTAQVNPENARVLLEPYLKEGKDILHIAFSSGLRGTYHSCRIAAEELMEEYPDRKIPRSGTSGLSCTGEERAGRRYRNRSQMGRRE